MWEPFVREKYFELKIFNNGLEFGLNQLELYRIYLDISDFKQAALTCYEKLNGVKEGCFQITRKIPNEY